MTRSIISQFEMDVIIGADGELGLEFSVFVEFLGFARPVKRRIPSCLFLDIPRNKNKPF